MHMFNFTTHIVYCFTNLSYITNTDLCDPMVNPCINGGQCIRQPESYQCDCAKGFGGPNCGTDLCKQKACNTNNTISRMCTYTKGGDAVCPCVPGYTGERCQVGVAMMFTCDARRVCKETDKLLSF